MNKEEIKLWLSQYGISKYTIHDNLVVDVHQQVSIYRANLTSLPFQFGIIEGYFDCDGNKLTSLDHCPKIVHDDFFCDDYLKNDIRYLRYFLAKQLSEL